jgi:hypothetical protein
MPVLIIYGEVLVTKGFRAYLSNGFSNRSTTTSLLARLQARSLPGFIAPTLTSRSLSPDPGSIITAGCGLGFLGRVGVPLTVVDLPALVDTSCSTNEDSLHTEEVSMAM